MQFYSRLTAVTRVLLAGTALALMSACAPMVQKPEKPSFVIQVSDNDPAKWNLALNNAKNVQSELGKDNVAVEIVAYGPGLNMLKLESSVAGRIQEAHQSGVQVMACGNTMKGMHLTKEDLSPDVTVVKAGVLEIGDKQQKGWTYIRP